ADGIPGARPPTRRKLSTRSVPNRSVRAAVCATEGPLRQLPLGPVPGAAAARGETVPDARRHYGAGRRKMPEEVTGPAGRSRRVRPLSRQPDTPAGTARIPQSCSPSRSSSYYAAREGSAAAVTLDRALAPRDRHGGRLAVPVAAAVPGPV